MSKYKDDKWLDELITRTINTTKPQFDSEKWKQRFPKEFKMLFSRSDKASTATVRLSNILKSPITKLAAAALIILAIGFFLTHLGPSEKVDTTDVTTVTKSPVEMMTAMSLERAFRRGGIEAVESQCEEAFKPIRPVSRSLSIEQILAEFNGT